MFSALIRSSTSPGLYNLSSLTNPTTGICCCRRVASNFTVISVMAAADMEFAAPAGKSSMVMATWRSGVFAAGESKTPRVMQKARMANRQVSNGFIRSILHRRDSRNVMSRA